MKDLDQLLGMNVEVPQIRLRRLDQLIPYHRNSRTHDPAQVQQLKRLLVEFGWTNAVLVDEEGIVAGHGRCMAATELYRDGVQIRFPGGAPIPIGLVPTLDCTGWSPEQRKAYIIADNRSALSAGWDEEILALELRELDQADYDLSLTAFSEEELDLLLPEQQELPPAKDPDDAPPLGETAVSEEGDVWVLGAHRVCCGDATSPDDWARLMGGELADVVWTDPPYNVDLGRKNKLLDQTIGGRRSAVGAIANDKLASTKFADLIGGIYRCLMAVMKPGAPIYVAHSDKEGRVFRNLFEDAGFHFSQMIIWKKNMHVLGMADFQPIHEPVIYGWKPGSRHRWYGGRKQTTVMDLGDGAPIQRMPDGRWQIAVGDQVLIVSGEATLEEAPSSVMYEPKPERSGLHASQKPVNLIERMLKNSARSGDIVADACGGSGSTLIAADNLAMYARLMEKDPLFVDVIVRRWQDYTGRRAVHARTGMPFPGDSDEPEVTAKPEPDSASIPDPGPDLF